MHAIGIDIGVTNIKSVVVTGEGRIVDEESTPTLSENPDWPGRVRSHLGELMGRHGETEIVGVAAPGMAHPDGTHIWWMQGRLGEVQGLNWTEFLDLPRLVPVLNDAQAALMGEVWQGAARGAQTAILLTLGTGVGGAVISEGRLLKGRLGRAGHLGHVSLDPEGPLDIVNTPGSLESAIGNCTVVERTGGRFGSTHELVAAHVAGDEFATGVWVKSVTALAAAVASLINVVDPEVVIIGGGIAASGAALFEPLGKFLDEFEWRPQGDGVRVVPAELGEHAGALGAAYNAMLAVR